MSKTKEITNTIGAVIVIILLLVLILGVPFGIGMGVGKKGHYKPTKDRNIVERKGQLYLIIPVTKQFQIDKYAVDELCKDGYVIRAKLNLSELKPEPEIETDEYEEE